MTDGLRVCLVDADKVVEMRHRAGVLMAEPDFSENGEMLKCFLEELSLWDEESHPKNNRGSQFIRQIIYSLTKDMYEKHYDDGEVIAVVSGAFTALRELHPGETITVAEISELLDAMFRRDQSKEIYPDAGQSNQGKN